MSFLALQLLLCFVSYHLTTSFPSIFPLVRKKNFFNVDNNTLFSNNSLPIQHRRRLALMMGNFVHPTISDDYFHAILYIGTPPQRVEMALDTGSGLPYFACQSTCKHCGKHDDPHFNITGSNTFEWLPCKSNLCSGSCKSNKCEWSQKYIDKSSISALVASDKISFYSWPNFPKQKSHKIESVEYQSYLRLVFGCSVREANTIFRQGADGVMGLSMHRRSFVDQLFTQEKEYPLGKKQFAHCFGQKTGGLLLFGSKEINQLLNRFNIHLQWASFLTKNNGHGWYKVKTVGFRIQTHHPPYSTLISNTSIDVKYISSMISGYRGSVMDTGSSTFSLPARPAKDIRQAIIIIINKHSPNSETFGWEVDKSKNYDFFLTWNGESKCSPEKWIKFRAEYLSIFPDIIMLLENRDSKNVEFQVQSKQYLLYKKQRICLDLFGDTPSILIGSNVMVDKFIVYDREGMKLGIADFNCDSLMNMAVNENSTSLNYIQPALDESDSYIEPLPMNERKFEEHKFVIHINIFNWKTYVFYFLSFVTFLVMYWIFGRKFYQYLCSSVCKSKKIVSVKHFVGNRKIRGKRKRVNISSSVNKPLINDDSYMFVNSVNEENGLQQHNINMDVLSQTTPMTNFTSVDLKSSAKRRE